MLVNLDRIPAAHGDMRLGISGQMRELMVNTHTALRVALGVNGLESSGPDVARENRAVERRGTTGKEFQGLGYFERGDQIDDWAEDADGVTGVLEAGA